MNINIMACLFLIVKGTSRKIDHRISQIEFDEVVGKVLKHAPSKQGGYRFKVRAQFKLLMTFCTIYIYILYNVINFIVIIVCISDRDVY